MSPAIPPTKTARPKRAIVTGGAGFIGSHVVDELVKRRFKVVVIDDLSSGQKENMNPNVLLHRISVTSPKVREVFKRFKPDYVFHLAAQISVRESIKDPLKDARTNILGTINVLEACREAQVKKIVVASSGGIMYPGHLKRARETDNICPESPYGVAKRTKELYLDHYYKVFNLPYVALRLANVYGPRQIPKGGIEGGAAAIFLSSLLRKKPVFITGNGKQTRDFVYVSDVAKAFVAAGAKEYVGIVNVSSGRETSIRELFRAAKRVVGSKDEPRTLPAVPGEKAGSCMSYTRATRVLGWRPRVSLEEGLKKTKRFFERQGHRA